ncbi:MSHA biogenesis protein MshF [Shewanella olleyana]|uniref:MSHA biogenesis protein MshF n=1 Tax=Shewanella olleyana TaxID=135626 RepID=UPI00201022D1|nr:MSHA biogenesis protein MshF [Shewanella olleyana]MCL1068468.1 MSHA biogenesis protein MshF [Shewanella olleyana]
MRKQQKSESDLLKTYARIISLTLVIVIMGVIGTKHFSSVDSIGTKSLELEHSRLLYVLAMVKSQWLSQGRPNSLKLSWENIGVGSANKQLGADSIRASKNIIKMSDKGWPQLSDESEEGCKELWQHLMASNLHDIKAEVFYQNETKICRFATEQSGSISYQTSSGRVIFFDSDR